MQVKRRCLKEVCKEFDKKLHLFYNFVLYFIKNFPYIEK